MSANKNDSIVFLVFGTFSSHQTCRGIRKASGSKVKADGRALICQTSTFFTFGSWQGLRSSKILCCTIKWLAFFGFGLVCHRVHENTITVLCMISNIANHFYLSPPLSLSLSLSLSIWILHQWQHSKSDAQTYLNRGNNHLRIVGLTLEPQQTARVEVIVALERRCSPGSIQCSNYGNKCYTPRVKTKENSTQLWRIWWWRIGCWCNRPNTASTQVWVFFLPRRALMCLRFFIIIFFRS